MRGQSHTESALAPDTRACPAGSPRGRGGPDVEAGLREALLEDREVLAGRGAHRAIKLHAPQSPPTEHGAPTRVCFGSRSPALAHLRAHLCGSSCRVVGSAVRIPFPTRGPLLGA